MPTPSTVTPTKVTIKVEAFNQILISDCVEYTFYINGQEYKKLPLDANVREPDTKKSKPYKDMLSTLSEQPEYFFENNLGISVIATDITEKSNNKFELSFNSGTGILNGGHTQQAILNSQSEPNIAKAIVRVTVRVKDYDSKRIAEIASAQNSSTAVKEYSLAEKRGLFAELKKHIDPNLEKHIIWWEGKTVPNGKGLEPVDLIALINVFNVSLYQSPICPGGTHPTTSASSKATVFKKWENEDYSSNSYRNLYPLIDDILKLYEHILLHFADGSGMALLDIISDTKGKAKELIFSTNTPPYILPKQMMFPLLAAYRANVYYDAANKKIGWYEDNFDLFERYNKELCGKLRSAYKSVRDPNRIGKDPIIWDSLYLTMHTHVDTTKVFKEYDI